MQELRFTGNWFIDAGILGFVNLMEEVYGWDLEFLNEKLKENPERVFCCYFPLAYLFYHSKVRGAYNEIQNIRKQIRKNQEKIEKKEQELIQINRYTSTSDARQKNKLTNKINKIKENINSLNDEIEKCNAKININECRKCMTRGKFYGNLSI